MGTDATPRIRAIVKAKVEGLPVVRPGDVWICEAHGLQFPQRWHGRRLWYKLDDPDVRVMLDVERFVPEHEVGNTQAGRVSWQAAFQSTDGLYLHYWDFDLGGYVLSRSGHKFASLGELAYVLRRLKLPLNEYVIVHLTPAQMKA